MKDINNQEIKQGDAVVIPLALGNAGIGNVVAVNSGLVNPNNPGAPVQASVTIRLEITIPATPFGIIPGIVKFAPQQERE